MGVDFDDEDDAAPGMGHNSDYDQTAGQLQSYLERMDYLDEQLNALKEDKKELYAEMKGAGFDRKAFDKARKAIEIQKSKKKVEASQELRAVTELYVRALDHDVDLLDLLL